MENSYFWETQNSWETLKTSIWKWILAKLNNPRVKWQFRDQVSSQGSEVYGMHYRPAVLIVVLGKLNKQWSWLFIAWQKNRFKGYKFSAHVNCHSLGDQTPICWFDSFVTNVSLAHKPRNWFASAKYVRNDCGKTTFWVSILT